MLIAPLPPTFAPPPAITTVTASTASCRGETDAKNESVERLKLSLLLMPSIVIWTIDSGSPLMVESRLIPAVLIPGRNVTALIALREAVGIRFNWSAFSVAATTGVCVLINSELLETLIVSVIAPTSRTILTAVGVFSCTTTSATAVLNPLSATLTLYAPAATAGTLKAPSPLVTASNDAPDSFLTVTAAPGMAPPALSTTVPEIAPAPCARTDGLAPSTSAANRDRYTRLRFNT